jgi:hypothetical protein
MSEDEMRPPDDEPEADRSDGTSAPPPYDPDYELIGYLEEKEGGVQANKRRQHH